MPVQNINNGNLNQNLEDMSILPDSTVSTPASIVQNEREVTVYILW